MPHPPSIPTRWPLSTSLHLHWMYALCGILDALRAYPYALLVLYYSSTMRVVVLKCVLLNGVIFLGSLGVSYALGVQGWLGVLYHVMWVWPVYVISFLLNSIWYQDIADLANNLQTTPNQHGTNTTPRRSYPGLSKVLTDEVYRILLLANLLLQTSLVYYFIPFVGSVLSFVHVCWVYSLYSFEYTWTHLSWSIPMRIQFFEERWSYFLGFGCPCALLTFWSAQFVGSGIFALLFPIYIIMANIATPLPVEKHEYIGIMDVLFSTMAKRVRSVARRGEGVVEEEEEGGSRQMHGMCPERLSIFWYARKASGIVLGVVGRWADSKSV